MKAPKFSVQKFQMLIAFCFATAILNFPVWPQDTKPMKKFYCQYCGTDNLMTRKFCSTCGSRLPDSVSVQPSYEKRLAALDNGKFNATSMMRDSLEAQILTNGWNGPSERQQTSASILAAAGLIGGTIGFFAGGSVGAGLASDCTGDFCGIEEAFFGAVTGESLGIPLGVHLANGGRGNLLFEILASAGIGAAGLALLGASMDSPSSIVPIATVVITPAIQLIACTAIERSTGH